MSRFSRRRILQVGVGGALLLGAGGMLSWVTRGYAVPPGTFSLALSIKERVIVRSIVEALCPGGDGLAAGLALGVDQRVDEELWSQPPEFQSDLRAVLHILEHAPPLVGSMGRLSSLPALERVVVLDELLRRGPGVIVQGVVAMKQICALFYWGHPGTWSAIGYDGPWAPAAIPPPSSVRYAELLSARSAG